MANYVIVWKNSDGTIEGSTCFDGMYFNTLDEVKESIRESVDMGETDLDEIGGLFVYELTNPRAITVKTQVTLAKDE